MGMVQNAIYDPIVVELKLTPSKVDELLLRGHESPKLDYKIEVDYASAESRLKLVKHVLAMANSAGGYIVVGVRDNGTREGLDPSSARLLDESTVRGWVDGFTDVPIVFAVHNSVSHEGKTYVVIAILPLLGRVAVATGDAQYTDNGKNVFAFRKGAVLVRHGSSSERWTQPDADYILQRIALAQKEEWIREFAPDFRAMLLEVIGSGGTGAIKASIDPSSFRLSPEEFQKLVLSLLRSS